jgi:hypothetical protein
MAICVLLGAVISTTALAADKPTGELRIALAFLGAQRMIPWVEVPSGGIKQYQLLIYDHLVGCTDDGPLSRQRYPCLAGIGRTEVADVYPASYQFTMAGAHR